MSSVPENLKEYMAVLSAEKLIAFYKEQKEIWRKVKERETWCHCNCRICRERMFVYAFTNIKTKQKTGQKDKSGEFIYRDVYIPSVRIKCTCGHYELITKEQFDNALTTDSY